MLRDSLQVRHLKIEFLYRLVITFKKTMNIRDIFLKISSGMSVIGAVIASIVFVNTLTDRQLLKSSLDKNYVIIEKNIKENINNTQKVNKEIILRIQKSIEAIKELKKNLKEIKEEQQRIILLASFQRMDPKLQEKFIETVSSRVQKNLSSSFTSSVDKLGGRLQRIEELVISNPNKALSIPLLRRDIGDINKDLYLLKNKVEEIDNIMIENAALKSQAQSLQVQLSQLNNLMIGIFGALGVSVIGLVINNIILHNKNQENG